MAVYGQSSAHPRVTFHWHPVRCCCNPAIIYGFLPVKAGQHEFIVRDTKGQPHAIQLRPLSQPFPGVTPRDVEQRKAAAKANPNQIHMPFVRDTEMAVFADDRPIEFWLSLKGFVPAELGHETFPQEPIQGLDRKVS